jgi:Linalool dehydratase/isomerase
MSATATPAAGLSDRALGWLRFIWDKATTPDDWSDRGEPHPWWDRYSAPPMCVFPRFDLSYMVDVLPVMLEATPAWQEAYTRIADELIDRYTSFWGSIDWCTLIGPDPGVDRYPPDWLTSVPEPLRGRYAVPGWTGNGVEPWGLQPDPVGADGNLFYRGWLNLLLGMRRYVSGESREHRPFDVTGYHNRQFTWTHARIAEFISAQFRARPQGPHCENTKIWPFCVSAAGLGLKLYDALLGTSLHEPFPRWLDYARQHYISLTRRGELGTFAFYYDPMEQRMMNLPGPFVAYAVFPCLPYLYPQDRGFAVWVYELAMRRLGWDNPDLPLIKLHPEPRHLCTAMWMAHEIGDTATEDRIRDFAESEYQPRFFGDENDRFAFWFGYDSTWPRGQVNAIMMLAESASPGAWWRVFNEPRPSVASEPVLRGVDYPGVGIRRARSDMARGVLHIETTAGIPSRRGEPTSFSIDQIPSPAEVSVTVDRQDSAGWHVTGSDSIRLDLDIDDHQIRVAFPGGGSRPSSPDRGKRPA